MTIAAALLLALPTGCKRNKGDEAAGSQETEAGDVSDETAAAPAVPEGEEWQEDRGRAEHRAKGKYKETGVYLDGEPIGFLKFGELPLGLEPVWIEQVSSPDVAAGEPEPPPEVKKVRRYRLAEYLEQIGVDLAKVKEVHLYSGPYAGIITGAELRRHRDTIYFRYSRETTGKVLPIIPEGVRFGTSFDSTVLVTVYIDKKPPKQLKSAEIEFEGRLYSDVPYFGKPLRGGIRVYKDDKFAFMIKRRHLKDEEKLGSWEGDELRWRLEKFLEESGVDLSDVVTAELVYRDRRTRRLSGEEIRGTYFVTEPLRRGEILLGEEKWPAEALALYTRELPAPDADDVRYELAGATGSR